MTSHTAWSFEGNYLSVSRVAAYHTDAPPLHPLGYMDWSVSESPLMTCHKTAYYAAAGDPAPAPAAAGGGGAAKVGELASAEEYLAKHQVHEKLQDAVNSVLATMPNNALQALSQALSSGAPAAKGGAPAAAAAAPAAAGGSEEEIKAQGDLVRKMKEANKAAANTHSKEELDAAITKLKELKGG
eukprot:CAMPEP_0173430962 /NCGR_PEP_ID=MMETSP1357-20121228/9236_1 /TAXON_ID=77926 /ORGANISM="Hemiselmis rufescens, Strain PCC563" /LENGTH=184 /DNA_ID=CAMNT_0014395377 /DNA_START=102 /DNA_END=652 /DNA_ORIENTATION=+